MKLNDARKHAIRRQTRIGFRLSNGMNCWIDRHGLALVPELKSQPDFNLEQEFAVAGEFFLEPAGAAATKAVSRAEMEVWCAPKATAAQHDPEHEE